MRSGHCGRTESGVLRTMVVALEKLAKLLFIRTTRSRQESGAGCDDTHFLVELPQWLVAADLATAMRSDLRQGSAGTSSAAREAAQAKETLASTESPAHVAAAKIERVGVSVPT